MTPEKPKRTIGVVHGCDPWPQIHVKTPREKKDRTKFSAGEGTISATFFGSPFPTLQPSTLRALTFRAPTLRTSTLRTSTFSCGSFVSGSALESTTSQTGPRPMLTSPARDEWSSMIWR